MGYYNFYFFIKKLGRFFKYINSKLTDRVIFIIIGILLVIGVLSIGNISDAHTSAFDNLTTISQGQAWALYKGIDDKVYAIFSGNNYNIYTAVSSQGNRLMVSRTSTDSQVISANVYLYDLENNQLGALVFNGPGYQYSYNTYTEILDINKNIYYINTDNTIAYNVQDFDFQYPTITTSSTDIVNWSFDTLDINGGDVSPYYTSPSNNNYTYPYLFDLQIVNNDLTYILDIQDYVSINENTNTFNINIPKAYITSQFNVGTTNNLTFTLIMHSYYVTGEPYQDTTYLLNSSPFAVSFTTEQASNVNADSQRFLQNKTYESITQQPKYSDDNINNFSNIDNGMSINDNTSINAIFDRIYTAFTTKYNDNNIGYGYTLSLPIPFTDKTLDISPHTIFGRSWNDLYESENKYSYEAVQVVYRFICTIWWFVIGSFILKDVRSIINKVAEGDIENVGSDVKKEIL